MPCHVGHFPSNPGKVLRGTDIKELEVVPFPAACSCSLLNRKKMVLCATYSTDPLAPIGKRPQLWVGLFVFITNNLPATPAPEMLGAIRTEGGRPGLPSARSLHRPQTRLKSHPWAFLGPDSKAGRFFEASRSRRGRGPALAVSPTPPLPTLAPMKTGWALKASLLNTSSRTALCHSQMDH